MLEGTLSKIIIFYHSELLTIKTVENHVKVESEILVLQQVNKNIYSNPFLFQSLLCYGNQKTK
jgi:hypothetical protein